MIDRQTDLNPSGFRLNGWHVLAMLVAFFGVVFAVNFTMMRYAVTTFSGVERASPYQDGLAFNSELADSRRQDAMGWSVDASIERGVDGVAKISVQAKDAGGTALSSLAAGVVLERPADRREDRKGELALVGAGRYAGAVSDVAPGQWDLVVSLLQGGKRVFLSRSRVILK
ncbi:FixH family protein [Alsobacter sp. SYSU M60028]|uniref:FixH family protein n=1 Tax=Alsobacter ponti TaxID=2962936 RepID=A0ABT1L7D4_9HYPH|nr:FixH family protein [Alsobacter ponti]MCP8936986.1 FixH family protein [Alsobacter ponti]